MSENSFGARADLEVGGRSYEIYRLDALQEKFDVARLPFSLKVLLENLLRNEDGVAVRKQDIEALASWDHNAEPSKEIAFTPARVVMQDFTGVPAIVDLAAMRDAMADLGGDPNKINPLVPAELVIDHSVQVDSFGTRDSLRINTEREYERNQERYEFLRWGQTAFEGFVVVPPETGIVHQVNLEYLARVVFENDGVLYPDTLVGTDSHTTMINGLGVLGWGVGGIEAEAAMLGQAMSMLIPRVVGFKLGGELPEGATATDLVLTVTQLLREHGVVGKFVEFYGPGIPNTPLADRATIGNMSPEFGSTCAIFPIDAETLRYMEFTGRSSEQVALVEAYARAQGLWHDENSEEPTYSETLELDLGDVVPSLAGPKRPQDRVALTESKAAFRVALESLLPDPSPSPRSRGTDVDEEVDESFPASDPPVAQRRQRRRRLRAGRRRHRRAAGRRARGAPRRPHALRRHRDRARPRPRRDRRDHELHQHVEPVGDDRRGPAGQERGREGPGVQALGEDLAGAGLEGRHGVLRQGRAGRLAGVARLPPRRLRLHDLHRQLRAAAGGGLERRQRRGSRGRVRAQRQPQLRGPDQPGREDELPRLAAARRGLRAGGDDGHRPARRAARARAPTARTSTSRTSGPAPRTSPGSSRSPCTRTCSSPPTARSSRATSAGRRSRSPRATASPGPTTRPTCAAPRSSRTSRRSRPSPSDIEGARVLAKLGDSVTTDHISPAGAIKKGTPAALYLNEHGVEQKDFNSYGSRRGNHEVMVRGTFANIRLRNQLAPGTEGGFTRHMPDGEEMTIYDASLKYAEDEIPLLVLAGKEYGSGSSRDWAAKGTNLLGVRAVIAESYERIHRSNLVGMGVLPLQFADGENAESLGLTGEEEFSISGVEGGEAKEVTVRADDKEFTARVRIDTPKEVQYYQHGGILPFVLRSLL